MYILHIKGLEKSCSKEIHLMCLLKWHPSVFQCGSLESFSSPKPFQFTSPMSLALGYQSSTQFPKRRDRL